MSEAVNYSMFWWVVWSAGVFTFFTLRQPISLWFQAFVSGTPVPLPSILGMALRKTPPRLIVTSYINLHKAGLSDIRVADIETHYLAGGHISSVVQAMIASDKAGIILHWRQATAIDLAGRDILDAVRTSVNPKVIDCPKGGEYISAVAQDGVQLQCLARVTVRTNIQQLVGGATEETIIARVGEGIVNSIGGAQTHTQVLARPQSISQLVLDKGLDAQTAFEILSIDIADINIGDNIGARLRADQAESDKRVAQAKAEESRAMAMAVEQQNKAEVMAKRAEVIAAEAQIPAALAHAFREGKLGVMDYYSLQNMQADTQMRRSISGEGEEKGILARE